jgi:hypothetical protein
MNVFGMILATGNVFLIEEGIPVLRSNVHALPELTEHCDFFEVTRCKFQLKPLRALGAV